MLSLHLRPGLQFIRTVQDMIYFCKIKRYPTLLYRKTGPSACWKLVKLAKLQPPQLQLEAHGSRARERRRWTDLGRSCTHRQPCAMWCGVGVESRKIYFHGRTDRFLLSSKNNCGTRGLHNSPRSDGFLIGACASLHLFFFFCMHSSTDHCQLSVDSPIGVVDCTGKMTHINSIHYKYSFLIKYISSNIF